MPPLLLQRLLSRSTTSSSGEEREEQEQREEHSDRRRCDSVGDRLTTGRKTTTGGCGTNTIIMPSPNKFIGGKPKSKKTQKYCGGASFEIQVDFERVLPPVEEVDPETIFV